MTIIIHTEDSVFCWASTGAHDAVECFKALHLLNKEAEEIGLGHPYLVASNEKGERFVYKEILEKVEKLKNKDL